MNVAGGRKTMPIDATLISIARAVKNVYHIVAPKIPGVETNFAELVSGKKDSITVGGNLVSRDKLLEELERGAENPEKVDEGIVEYLLKLCFPPKDLKFYLIKIPIPYLTLEERRKFKEEVLP